ncbi:MAG: hypothetical protein KAR64_01640 [Thermoplasmatales archaeon]|nr:hypothetical protein [Thermoplasmatales archaeon]
MKKYVKWIIGFGILIWLIPFLVSFVVLPLKDSNRPLFESIMPVVLTITVVIFSILFFKRVDREFMKEGFIIGIVWFTISIVIDLFMFIPESSMHMSLVDYIMDIGLTYLIILVIPVGFGYMLEKKN